MAELAQHQICMVLAGRITAKELIDWCWDADRQWPGIGWGKTAYDLQARQEDVKQRGFVFFRGHWRSTAYLPDHRAGPSAELPTIGGVPYAELVEQERWMLGESHWRARWNLAKRDAQYRSIGDAIPERLRIQFAEEDRERPG